MGSGHRHSHQEQNAAVKTTARLASNGHAGLDHRSFLSCVIPARYKSQRLNGLWSEKISQNPYHRVTFDLVSDGIPASQLVIWVHPAFPDDDLVRVAHTFAWSRLAALTEAASSSVFSADQIQALWEQVRQADFAAQ